MSNPAAIERSRNEKRRALDLIYAWLVIDTPRVTTDGDVADRIRMPKQAVSNLRYDLEETGSLRSERKNDGKFRKQQWTLVDPLETARQKLDAKWAKDDKVTEEKMKHLYDTRLANEAKGVTFRGKPINGRDELGDATPDHPVVPDQLVHSAGPNGHAQLAGLAPERYDEPGALVEAAKQYANVRAEVDKRFKELEALGVKIDRDKIAKGMQLPEDSRLAAVAIVLPYIERLERVNERLTMQNEDLRQKATGLSELQGQVGRLKSANERLIAEKTALLNERGNTPKANAPAAAG